MLGPVQVLVVGVDGSDAEAAVLASVGGLPADGPVRCLDAFAVSVTESGELTGDDTGPPSLGLFAEEDEDRPDGPADRSTWSLADVVPPGTRAVVLLLEHRWATGLVESMAAAGGALAHESWLDADDRSRLEALLGPS